MNFNRRSMMVAALAGAALFSNGLSATAQTQLNLSDVLPESNFMVKNATRFAEEVSAATSGEVLISVKPGGSMGFKGPDQLTAVRDGLVEMADINISQQVGVTRSSALRACRSSWIPWTS